MADILGESLAPSENEMSFEISFVVMKFKHSIKRKKEIQLKVGGKMRSRDSEKNMLFRLM